MHPQALPARQSLSSCSFAHNARHYRRCVRCRKQRGICRATEVKENEAGHKAEGDGDEEVDAFDAAARELDSADGPKYFTDFFKSVLHPRAVVEVPLLPLGRATDGGFGGLVTLQEEARQVRVHSAAVL